MPKRKSDGKWRVVVRRHKEFYVAKGEYFICECTDPFDAGKIADALNFDEEELVIREVCMSCYGDKDVNGICAKCDKKAKRKGTRNGKAKK